MGPESLHSNKLPGDANAVGPQTTLCSKDSGECLIHSKHSRIVGCVFSDESEAMLDRSRSNEPEF